MKDISWHLAEALKKQAEACYYFYSLSDAERREVGETVMVQATVLMRAMAQGAAYGHAFRAAELAYDLAAVTHRRVPRIRRYWDGGMIRLVAE